MEEAKEAAKPDVPSVSNEEILSILGVPAVHANKFYVTLFPYVARITFSESIAGADPVARAAVTLSLSDAVELRDLLIRMTAQLRLVEAPPAEAPDVSK